VSRRLRPAVTADADAMCDIYAPFVEETAISFETEPPTSEEFETRIEETTETYPWLVAERVDGQERGAADREFDESDPGSGTVIGYASADALRSTPPYRWTAELSVYVADGHRGSGVGSMLYAALCRILREQGFYSAYAATTLPNPASVALHERFDFDPVGTLPAVGHKHGEWHDVRWWHRQLAERPADPDPPVPFSEIRDAPELRALLEERVDGAFED
jgi:phosphinothricin acetyltransferase